jgi:Amidohydrolase
MKLKVISWLFLLLVLNPRYCFSFEYCDSHVHLTDYVQMGGDLRKLIPIMDKLSIKRIAVFGIPLAQKWNMYEFTSLNRPRYYLNTEEELYYYSAVDARIAREYLALSYEQQKRFDPMITGFNPTDGYGVEHIKNMLTMYPGVFSGIGEFTIYKELVSSKVSGENATLINPALERIFSFAEEAGILLILHSDIDSIKSVSEHKSTKPMYLQDLKKVFVRHPNATIIWAHTGLGRYVKPSENHLTYIENVLKTYPNVYCDISWVELAKYITKDNQSLSQWASLIKRYPSRFIFGTDTVRPNLENLKNNLDSYQKLWEYLPPSIQAMVKKGNYERLFSQSRKNVRSWEAKHVNNLTPTLNWPYAQSK